jgi:hypothetical protein
VATWDDGTMSVAEVRAGRGRFILLGTPFYTRMKDVKGMWVNDEQRGAMLDEFISSLGVARDSWTGARDVWAEAWRSKNGVYDLYPVARMTRDGDATRNVRVALRRATPPASVVEISALTHPEVKTEWKDGRLTLPAADYGQMQARVFVAPRAEIARAAMDWFRAQASIWRALPPLPEIRKPAPVPVADDLLPLADGWTLKVEGQPDKAVRLGAFGTLGLPETTVAAFEKTVTVPATWKGCSIDLVFNAEHWFWGILPQARLLINGKEAAMKQPIIPGAQPGFALDVSEAAAGGTVALRLEIDGTARNSMRKDGKGQVKPHGVTGLFYLQATAPTVKSEPLAGPWQAATAFNRLQPVKVGDKTKCLYLETRFVLPQARPAKRVFLASPEPLGFLMLNGQALQVPTSMQRLDISGLVKPADGENVLRWVPASRGVAAWNRQYQGTVPELNLLWIE